MFDQVKYGHIQALSGIVISVSEAWPRFLDFYGLLGSRLLDSRHVRGIGIEPCSTKGRNPSGLLQAFRGEVSHQAGFSGSVCTKDKEELAFLQTQP